MTKITEKALKGAVTRLSGTDDGKIFLAALKQDCRWDDTIVGATPEQTHFYAARRGVYGGIRKYIPIKNLKEIEFEYQIIAEETKK